MSGPKGFVAAKKAKVKRLVISIEGQEKDGKTTFALSAPGPIALIDMDTGLEGVVDKVIGEKKVWVREFDYRDAIEVNGAVNQDKCLEIWEEMRRAYLDALESTEVRSVVMDTATEAWELCRLARLGRLTSVKPHHYGPVNAEFRDLVKKAYKHDKNVVFVHKLKDEYLKDVRTGKKEMAGFKDMPYVVQASMRIERDEEGMFVVKVINCRHNAEMMGKESLVLEPMSGFGDLAVEMWEGSTEEDWT